MQNLILIFCFAFIAATISRASGFGGTVLLLPMLTAVDDVKVALSILTIVQIFSNALRIWLG